MSELHATHQNLPFPPTVLGRQNISSEQPPPNMAAANFVRITNVSLMDAGMSNWINSLMGEWCAINGTAVTAVLIDQ